MQACSFNLIAYAPSSEKALRLKSILSMIKERFTYRLIFIYTQSQDSETLCYSSPDEVYIDLNCIEQVPFLVMPRLLHDLPIYLLWGSDPTTETALLPYFREIATHVIFDSTGTDSLNAFASRMVETLNHQCSSVIDVSWAQISGWRSTLLRLFNNAQQLDRLRFCQMIRIICYQSVSYGVGIYLMSWLSAQLDWILISSQRTDRALKFVFKHSKGLLEGEIITHPLAEQFQEEGISSIEFKTQEHTIYSLTYQPQRRTIIVHTEHPETCQLPMYLPYYNQTHLIKELFHRSPGEHYCNMLKALVQFSKEEIFF